MTFFDNLFLIFKPQVASETANAGVGNHIHKASWAALLGGYKFLVIVSLLLSSSYGYAQSGNAVSDEWLKQNYTKREVLVQVRDGAHIYASVFEPVREFMDSIGRSYSPVMLTMTPYSLKPYGLKVGETFTERTHNGYLSGLKGDMANYVADGYIIVYLNARGKYLSEGEYVNVRPYISGADGAVDTVSVNGKVQTDDATDIYDVIEWVLGNTKNNGNVGVKGVSYPGFYTTMAILSRHPAIKAASPQAPATDWYMGDDAHHNGAFCIADMYRFGSGFFRTRKKPSLKGMSSLFSSNEDIYEYFNGKPFSELSAFFGDSLSFWNDMMSHPDYDSFWQARNPSNHLKNISIPVLVTGGFYDAEDCYGAFKTYNMLKKNSPECELYLAVGPWYHGGWNNRTANHLAEAWFGNSSGVYYQDKVEYPFFSYFLDRDGVGGYDDSAVWRPASGSQVCDPAKTLGMKPARVNVLASRETSRSVMENAESDSLWESYEVWPPAGMKYRRAYLSGEDSLKLESKGVRPEKFTRSFVSNPESPVPYMDVKSDSRDRSYMVADQRFASERSDVLTYSCRTATDALHLAGPVKVHLELTLDECFDGKTDGDMSYGDKKLGTKMEKYKIDEDKSDYANTEDRTKSAKRGTQGRSGNKGKRAAELDADIVVKLIDVRPDGYQMLVRGDVMPLRFRDGFSSPKATEPGRKVEVNFTMCDIDHYIEPGHSLMVQVQGSWFPLIAMKPQKFLPNPYKAESQDYHPIRISVYSAKSYLELPVAPAEN